MTTSAITREESEAQPVISHWMLDAIRSGLKTQSRFPVQPSPPGVETMSGPCAWTTLGSRIWIPDPGGRPIAIEIQSVRSERMQEISHVDAVRMGWPGRLILCCGEPECRCPFRGANERDFILATGFGDDACIEWAAAVWNHAYPAFPYGSNPRAWVVDFKLAEGGNP